MAFWSKADIALPSVDDEMLLFADPDEETVVQRLNTVGATCGALKRGGTGPRDLSGATHDLQLTQVTKIVDTTAAGDSFNAGFLAAIVKGASIAEAMTSGHEIAAQVIQKRGAIVSLREEGHG